jgi:hypothetical protein
MKAIATSSQVPQDIVLQYASTIKNIINLSVVNL